MHDDDFTAGEFQQSSGFLSKLILLLLVLALGWGGYYLYQNPSLMPPEMREWVESISEKISGESSQAPVTAPEPVTQPKEEQPEAVQEQPEVAKEVEEKKEPSFQQQAMEEEDETIELPPLGKSDDQVREAVDTFREGLPLSTLLAPKEILRKFVLAVNNVAKGEISRKYPPITPPPQGFKSTNKGGKRFVMTEENYARYTPYIEIIEAIDIKIVVKVYRQYYPLMQEAHKELAATKGSFHASLLKAIDHLLQAPEQRGEIELIRPSVMYKYANPALEKLSAPHKLLLRTGPENTQKIKAVLKELRQVLAE